MASVTLACERVNSGRARAAGIKSPRGGCRRAWLNTEERNEAAVRFYLAHGWRIEGEPRVRDWHGARLVEPRFVRDLEPRSEADSF